MHPFVDRKFVDTCEANELWYIVRMLTASRWCHCGSRVRYNIYVSRLPVRTLRSRSTGNLHRKSCFLRINSQFDVLIIKQRFLYWLCSVIYDIIEIRRRSHLETHNLLYRIKTKRTQTEVCRIQSLVEFAIASEKFCWNLIPGFLAFFIRL